MFGVVDIDVQTNLAILLLGKNNMRLGESTGLDLVLAMPS
jgi:hypothetical protein